MVLVPFLERFHVLFEPTELLNLLRRTAVQLVSVRWE